VGASPAWQLPGLFKIYFPLLLLLPLHPQTSAHESPLCSSACSCSPLLSSQPSCSAGAPSRCPPQPVPRVPGPSREALCPVRRKAAAEPPSFAPPPGLAPRRRAQVRGGEANPQLAASLHHLRPVPGVAPARLSPAGEGMGIPKP